MLEMSSVRVVGGMSATDILALLWLIAGGLYLAQSGLSFRQSLFALVWAGVYAILIMGLPR